MVLSPGSPLTQMEELRLAISKYLSKIENKPVVVPAKEQLPESVHKVDANPADCIVFKGRRMQ